MDSGRAVDQGGENVSGRIRAALRSGPHLLYQRVRFGLPSRGDERPGDKGVGAGHADGVVQPKKDGAGLFGQGEGGKGIALP